ncbi:MAG: hypothetical protein IJT82_01775 [Schwartzia sp.]|nr:hypothetical protein [Schwartzia sp. (in: firmicutes)]
MLPEETHDMPSGKFIRILRELPQKAFSDFFDESVYNEEQISLVQCIMDWLAQNVTMERQELGDSDNLGCLSISEVFEPTTLKSILAIIDRVNANAMPMAT